MIINDVLDKEAFGFLESLPAEWGATEEELREVEDQLGVRLPAPLRELMLRTGRGMHMRWLFSDDSIPPLGRLVGLQDLAVEIIEGEPLPLRPTFPFVTLDVSDGGGFAFARAGHSEDDAEVFWYQELHGFDCGAGCSLRRTIVEAVWRVLHRV
ncbi:SMI1/KNR4 family protein [Tundrisphaera sp. TA3]|uniref:SMI1/KNR4 family protein n=1 Tax=Tundrisphaera sp. TA3 TaxID=3435775 RepID=UPI003EBCBD63